MNEEFERSLECVSKELSTLEKQLALLVPPQQKPPSPVEFVNTPQEKQQQQQQQQTEARLFFNSLRNEEVTNSPQPRDPLERLRQIVLQGILPPNSSVEQLQTAYKTLFSAVSELIINASIVPSQST